MDDNTIKLVDYVKNGEFIEITTKNLGKYVVSYKELAVSPSTNLSTRVEKSENNDNNLVWMLASVSLLLILFAIYFHRKNNDN